MSLLLKPFKPSPLRTRRLLSTMRAIRADSPGVATPHTVSIPSLTKPTDVLVQVKAVALNPTDWKVLYQRTIPGQRLGCDFSGVVVSQSESSSNTWKEGDRVAGFVLGGRDDNGAFADYVKADERFLWKVPERLSWEAASAMGGVASTTAVQSVYFRHNLNLPTDPVTTREPVLVWSGATSVGLYAIQLLSLSGYVPVVTTSPKNFDLVKSFGAEDVYAYSDPSTPSRISSAHPTLSRAIDTIGAAMPISKCFGAEAKSKTVWSTMPLAEGDKVPTDVSYNTHVVWSTIGHEFELWGLTFPSTEEEQAKYQDWLKYVPSLIASGKFQSNPLVVQEGGLDQVNDALAFLKQGVSGKKVVVKF